MRLAGVGLLCLGFLACAREEPFQARFAVRGRWPGERVLSFALGSEAGPLAPEPFRRALEEAMATWQATGLVAFRPALPDETPDVVFAWQRGIHGACVPFGSDPSVAHSGPAAPGTFVHFDAGRAWGETLSLRQAALHELGHVLGLDHSPDEGAVMYPEPSPARDRLARSDLAGLHALYGGGRERRGDLLVLHADGTPALSLPEAAPPELCAWTLFDADGDGDEEVLVWRTDRAGHGALWSFDFEPGPLLARVLGPAYGVTLPGVQVAFVHGPAGERLLLLTTEHGPLQAHELGPQGELLEFRGDLAALPRAAPAPETERCGDLDGDGTRETVRLRH